MLFVCLYHRLFILFCLHHRVVFVFILFLFLQVPSDGAMCDLLWSDPLYQQNEPREEWLEMRWSNKNKNKNKTNKSN